MNVKLVYFAWLRERLGIGEEEISLPDTVRTVSDLVDWLAGRNEIFEAAFDRSDVIQVAIDQQHVQDRSALLSGAREIALFPPMTGG